MEIVWGTVCWNESSPGKWSKKHWKVSSCRSAKQQTCIPAGRSSEAERDLHVEEKQLLSHSWGPYELLQSVYNKVIIKHLHSSSVCLPSSLVCCLTSGRDSFCLVSVRLHVCLSVLRPLVCVRVLAWPRAASPTHDPQLAVHLKPCLHSNS